MYPAHPSYLDKLDNVAGGYGNSYGVGLWEHCSVQVETAGRHERTWNGLDDRGQQVSSGVYFVQFAAADLVERRKIVLVK